MTFPSVGRVRPDPRIRQRHEPQSRRLKVGSIDGINERQQSQTRSVRKTRDIASSGAFWWRRFERRRFEPNDVRTGGPLNRVHLYKLRARHAVIGVRSLSGFPFGENARRDMRGTSPNTQSSRPPFRRLARRALGPGMLFTLRVTPNDPRLPA